MSGNDIPEPRWLTQEEQLAWRALLHGSARLWEILENELRQQFQISLAEYDILVRLDMACRRERRMADLALSSAQSRSRISHTVSRLERAGYVERISAPGDGRGVVARLTETGRELLVQAAKIHVAGVREHLVDQATPEDFAAMGRVFRAVERHLDDRCGRVFSEEEAEMLAEMEKKSSKGEPAR